LIVRVVEAAGIPTLSMTSALSITRSANVPRAAFLDYPLGHTSGPPNKPDVQLEIIRNSLELFNTLKTPGQIGTLPFVWSTSEGDAWKDGLSLPKVDSDESPADDERTERDDEPQYQNSEDARLARQGACDTCIWLC